MAEFLLELYSEEIPPQLQIEARIQIRQFVENSFEEHNIKYKDLSVYSSPTRLMLFIKNLTEKLLSWTGERWIISLSKNSNAKSIYEKNLEDKDNIIEEFKKSKVAQDIQKAFPDAKLIDLTEEE